MSSQYMVIHGRVGKDPEFDSFDGKNGTFEVARFPLAVDHKFDDGTDWFRCEVMGSTQKRSRIEFVEKHICKGKELILHGRHESRTIDKDGEKRTYWSFKIDSFDFCGKKDDLPTSSNSGLPASLPTVPAEPDGAVSNEDKVRAAIGEPNDKFADDENSDMPF